MAWNQSGNGARPPAGKREDSSLEETLKRWQKKAAGLWQPGGNRKALLAVFGLLLVAGWLASGFYQVGSAERGVLQRFGSYADTLAPGRGWHWPWPIEMLTTVDVETIASIDDRSQLLTADQSLLNVGWSAQYHRTDPRQWLFQLRNPEAALRQDAQGVLRRAVAAASMEAVLAGESRQRLADGVRATLQQTLDGEHAGVSVDAFNLTDVDVPDAVQAAQREVDKARMDSARVRQQAKDYADQILPQARSTAAQGLADAQNYRTQEVARAQGEAARFDALVDAYTKSPAVTRQRLYMDTMQSVLSRSHKIIIDTKTGTGNMIYLPLDKLLQAVQDGGGAAGSGAGGADAGVSSAVEAPAGVAEGGGASVTTSPVTTPAPAGDSSAATSAGTQSQASDASATPVDANGVPIGSDPARGRGRTSR